MQEEIWKDIPEYPGYQVSNFGRASKYCFRIARAFNNCGGIWMGIQKMTIFAVGRKMDAITGFGI